ncbi:hypothetical protein [Nostoc phage N1]|nr:hypothetical protein [Nostoc phage N1]
MRLLTGTIKHLDDSPWANVSVYLSLVDGTYDSENQYPIDVKSEKTDSGGNFSFNVVPNTGLSPSYYVLTTPDGKNHAFTVPDGTTPVDFSTLREAGILATDPEYTNVLQYIQDYIDDAIASIQASSVIADIFTCGQVISALKAIRYDAITGKVFYASSSDVTHLGKCVGISSQSGNINDNVQIITSGYLSDNFWNWTLGTPIFFDANGTLTQTPGINYYQVVGFPVSTTKILVSIEQPIKL